MAAMSVFISKDIFLKAESAFVSIKGQRSVTLTRIAQNMTKLSWKTENNRIVEKILPDKFDNVFNMIREKSAW